MLPDAFLAIDGLLETLLTILNQMDVYEKLIEAENQHYMPFLLTTTVLMAAVKSGVGREQAHGIIKRHALETVNDFRNGKITENNLLQRLAGESELGLDENTLKSIVDNANDKTGLACEQIDAFLKQVEQVKKDYQGASKYEPEAIL